MKNYNALGVPSLFAQLPTNHTMDYYATNFCIPDPKFGVDYYGILADSKYNVFRVDAVAIQDCGCNMWSVMYVHTPDGVRHTITNNSSCTEHHLNYFENKEDLMKFVLTGENENRMPHTTLKEFLKDALDDYTIEYSGYQGNTFNLKGYFWNHGRVNTANAYFDLAWKDEKGLHIVFNNRLYTTNEECFKDNFQLNTDVFPEDKPKVQVFKVSVTLEITAGTLEEAQEVAERKIAYLEE